MRETKVLSLLAEGENQRIDFKRELDLKSGKGKAEFVKDVVALANSAPDGGYLLIGVDYDKSIVGIGELEEERIQQIAHTYIDPPVVLRCSLVPMEASGFPSVGVIEINATSRPHKVIRAIDKLNKDDVFVRRGSIVARPSPEEIRRMPDSGTRLLWGWGVIALVAALVIVIFLAIQRGEQFFIFLANSSLLTAAFIVGTVVILISLMSRPGAQIELAFQRRIILAILGSILIIVVMGVSVSIAAETLSSFVVILGITLIPIGLIAMSYLAINAYRRQAEQKSSAAEKLRAKEAKLLASIEDDISALLKEEAR
jgi:hypothetical protein